jgi:hypothetical protein
MMLRYAALNNHYLKEKKESIKNSTGLGVAV